MPTRLMTVALSSEQMEELPAVLEEHPLVGEWRLFEHEGQIVTALVIRAEDAEALMDSMEQRFGADERFRVVLLPIEATLPRVEEKEPEPEEAVAAEDSEKPASRPRVSREEIYDDINEATRISHLYVAAAALSTLVAAMGLMRDNTAAVIGAMVIAPLLGPNAALALATTLADRKLAWRAVKANAIGGGIAFGISVLMGMALTVPLEMREISLRTSASFGDIVLALSAGVAGTMAFTSAVPTILVGVMVAVALLPPTVVAGLMAGSGNWTECMGAMVLVTLNVVCFNLAGVGTFLVLGIRPPTGLEKEQARRASFMALAVWMFLLAVLSFLIAVAL